MAEMPDINVRVRTEIADEPIPLDPTSLQGELVRLDENFENLDSAVDRLCHRVKPVLRDDDGVMAEAKLDDSGPSMTIRVRMAADRIAQVSRRLNCLADRIDL